MEGHRRRLSITLTGRETMALALARKMLEKLSAAPLAEAAVSAVAKVNDALPRAVAERRRVSITRSAPSISASHDHARHGNVLRHSRPRGLRLSWTCMEVVCPYCGEAITVFIDEGGGPRQRYVEDCSVCCRPIELSVEETADGELSIVATRADE